MHRDKLDVPYSWRKPRTVFTVSMGDLFHHTVPWRWIDEVFDTMVHCREHTFILCTKRAKNMHDFITKCYPGLDQCCPHIWGLVTTETQKRADERIPWLLRTPLAVRGVSVEPMLGEIDLREYLYRAGQHMVTVGQGPNVVGAEIEPGHGRLDWCVTGGESGPRARPTHPKWLRSLRDQCQQAQLPFFFKSWGAWIPYIELEQAGFVDVSSRSGFTYEIPSVCMVSLDRHPWKDKAGHLLDGKEYHAWPTT
jgi:protein gp37